MIFTYKAKADINGGKDYPNINGIVYFKQLKKGTMLNAKINGLPKSNSDCPGRFFGFHIHEGTSCTGNTKNEFANASSHFNPTHCPHPFHIGDLPPLFENKGYAYMSVLINKINIKDIIGKVIVIHEMPDDFSTQPSGNAGKMIACGKIEQIGTLINV